MTLGQYPTVRPLLCADDKKKPALRTIVKRHDAGMSRGPGHRRASLSPRRVRLMPTDREGMSACRGMVVPRACEMESWISQPPFHLAGPVPSEQLRLRSREEPVDDFEIVGERFRYLTLPNPWVDKLCTGTLWAQWP